MNRTSAITSRAWMKPPAVNEVTNPRPQRASSIIAIVKSMICLHLRERSKAIFAVRVHSLSRHATHFPAVRQCATEQLTISEIVQARRSRLRRFLPPGKLEFASRIACVSSLPTGSPAVTERPALDPRSSASRSPDLRGRDWGSAQFAGRAAPA